MAVSHSYPWPFWNKHLLEELQDLFTQVITAKHDSSPTGTRRRRRLWYVIYRIKLPMQIIVNADYDLTQKSAARDQNRRRGWQGESSNMCKISNILRLHSLSLRPRSLFRICSPDWHFAPMDNLFCLLLPGVRATLDGKLDLLRDKRQPRGARGGSWC